MDIKIVIANDWQGMYINDKLAAEDHELDAYFVLKTVAYEFNSKHISEDIDVRVYYVDEKWIEEQGCLPENFMYVKLTEEENGLEK